MNDVFYLTPSHIKLLRASNVSDRLSDCEYGAAEIDPKRPYGNSDVEGDIAGILGIELIDGEFLREADWERCRVLHLQTPTALRIVLKEGSFEPGIFTRVNLWDDWVRSDDEV